MNLIANTFNIFKRVNTDAVLVAFSGGKDSIVLLDLCLKYFKTVVPFYMYFVRDLEHVNKKLDQFEAYFKTEIIQIPHWMLSHYYARAYFRLDTKITDIKRIYVRDIENSLREKTGIEWVCNGMRKSDSIQRAIMFKTYYLNAINFKSKRFHPVSHWASKDINIYIKLKNFPKPFDYGNKRVSGLDITKVNLKMIRDNYPEDYKKVLAEFPLADSQLL